ncbi:MAG: hypothetical protein IPJ19_20165 [Planctomycetes bacterium]|nr:hypothetical protein [Planctomycetota bacterium]
MPEDPVFEVFRSASPREILLRIAEGDPLEIAPRCTEFLREEAWLIDAERMTLRSFACTAYAAVGYRGAPPLSEWLHARLHEAARQLLEEEQEAVQSGVPTSRQAEQHLRFLADALGVEFPIARRACVALNSLRREPRRTVWAVLIEGRSASELDRESGRPTGSARAHLVQAVEAIREWTRLDGWNWKAVDL